MYEMLRSSFTQALEFVKRVRWTVISKHLKEPFAIMFVHNSSAVANLVVQDLAILQFKKIDSDY